MLDSRIECPRGVPDCDPPTLLKVFSGIFAMLILLYLSDMVFYSLFDDTFSDDGMREIPLFLNLLIGYLIASAVFVLTYIYFGRSPRIGESENQYRSRTQKGLMYGVSIGSLVFIPAVFIMSSVEIDYNLGVNLLDSIYHVVQITVAGIVVAHILGMPPRT